MEPMRPEAVAHTTMPAPPTLPGSDMLADLLGRSPDECPEALRGIAMTRGTLESTRTLLLELERRLSHVLLPDEPRVSDPLPPLTTRTSLGAYADELYDDACTVERRVRDLLARLAGV